MASAGDLGVDAVIGRLEAVIKELRVAQAKDEADEGDVQPSNLKDAKAKALSVIRSTKQ